MPGMQAAFVEIGLERAAFLHASDILRLPQEPASSEPDDARAPLREDRVADVEGRPA
jgi:ribonuclease G